MSIIPSVGAWSPDATIFGSLWTARRALSDVIASLFKSGEQGFAYDINDLSTLFQDAAGTIPVTAAGQPVGLVLDKSKGLVLGPEINTNASFSSWSGGKPAGYGVFANNTTTFVSQVVDGVRFQSINGDKVQITRGISTYKFYQLDINVHSIVSGNIAVECGGVLIKLINSVGIHTLKFYSSSNTGLDIKRGGGVADFTIRSLSIKEIAGNHAYQATSASRPIFEQKPILGANFVTDSTLAEPSKWSTGAASGVSISGNKLIFNIVAAYNSAVTSTLSTKLTTGKRYLLSYIISGYVSGAVRAQIIGGATVNTTSFNKNGRVSLVITATANHSYIGFQSTVAGTTLNISEVYLQEITGYLADQNYLQFDGVDDFLQTSNIDFTATDKVSLFAGVLKLSDATTAALCEFSNNSTTTNGTFSFFAPTSPNPQYQFRSKGTSAAVYASSPTNAYPAPHSTVLTGFGSPTQNIARLRVNGIQVADTPTVQGTGNYGNYPLYIGRRGGTSLPFNGHLYSLIGVGRLATDAETLALEKLIAKNVGVTI